MASSSADLIGGGIGACPPPAAGVMDVHPDLEGWGRESRPPGSLVLCCLLNDDALLSAYS
uniref:Uncharacterized protein n=1 Tax=Oryza barthii TaxID=65489 RepID=A0A0D3GUP4_9ORYZ